jgi:hypothetical protein
MKKPAGTFNKHKYVLINFNGKQYQAHRIIWQMLNGQIPDGMCIDHIDRNPSNNRIENLRLATRQQNSMNNSSLGFNWDKRKKLFLARIAFKKEQKFIGYYNNVLDARAAYLRVRRDLFGEFA